jgi:release factor glutamine methyltransferase
MLSGSTESGTDSGLVTWRTLIGEATTRLGVALGGDREQEGRWIVERVSGYSPSELVANDDEFVSTRSMAFFDALLTRREGGEPLQYVLGRWQFRELELIVDRRVLIPRPETEWVLQPAIEHLRALVGQRRAAGESDEVRVVDLGTGSGAAACSIAVEVPTAQVWASDVSDDALAVARANVAGLGRAGGRVRLATGSWFDALEPELAGSFDLVFSNPPYVDDDELLPDDVLSWEPHLALFGGPDGTRDLRVIIEAAPRWLRPGGALVVEMAPKQTQEMARLAERVGMRADIRNDLTGRPRSLVCLAAR